MVTFKAVVLLISVCLIVVKLRRLKSINVFKDKTFQDSLGLGVFSAVAVDIIFFFLRMIF